MMAAKLEILIAGLAADAVPAVSSMSEFNVPEGMKAVPFEVRVPLPRLMSLMGADYAEFILELKADDEEFGDPVVELADAGYPADIESLIAHADALDVTFGLMLMADLLEKLAPASDDRPTAFFLTPHHENHATSCVRDGDMVVLKGFCAVSA